MLILRLKICHTGRTLVVNDCFIRETSVDTMGNQYAHIFLRHNFVERTIILRLSSNRLNFYKFQGKTGRADRGSRAFRCTSESWFEKIGVPADVHRFSWICMEHSCSMYVLLGDTRRLNCFSACIVEFLGVSFRGANCFSA